MLRAGPHAITSAAVGYVSAAAGNGAAAGAASAAGREPGQLGATGSLPLPAHVPAYSPDDAEPPTPPHLPLPSRRLPTTITVIGLVGERDATFAESQACDDVLAKPLVVEELGRVMRALSMS